MGKSQMDCISLGIAALQHTCNHVAKCKVYSEYAALG
jgi:hypothetical protein